MCRAWPLRSKCYKCQRCSNKILLQKVLSMCFPIFHEVIEKRKKIKPSVKNTLFPNEIMVPIKSIVEINWGWAVKGDNNNNAISDKSTVHTHYRLSQ